MKKLSTLIQNRQAALQQAHLANLAFAYHTLTRMVQRIDRARLRGTVTLRSPRPEEECFCASLTAHEGSQAVIDEHFSDEELLEFADVIGFILCNDDVDMTFQLEEVAEVFLAPLRTELENGGVVIDESNTNSDALR